MKRSFFLSLVICSCLSSCYTPACQAQVFENRHIARGADTAEIYITCHWYDDNIDRWGAIFRSTNNGESFSVQHKYVYPDERSEIFGDSLQGVLYQSPYGTGIGISYDYGATFEDKYDPIISYKVTIGGCEKGELYVEGRETVPGNDYVLYRITNFGDSLALKNTNMWGLTPLESGSLPGEVYAIQWPYYGTNSDTLGLGISNDYGQTFTINYIDTSIATNLNQHTISSGPAPGELYIAGVKNTYLYHILHSFDYGNTFELKCLFPANKMWYDYSFVAGRKPGTFYIIEESPCPTGPLHNCITIYFSRDYGTTYTPYFNELDSLYTGISENPRPTTDFNVFPNPTTEKLTVEFSTKPYGPEVELFDITGRLQATIRIDQNSEKTEIDISGLKPGIYLLKLRDGDRMTGMKKVVIGR